MTIKKKLANDEKVALYEEFFKTMIELGFSMEYIGAELALIAHAIYFPEK